MQNRRSAGQLNRSWLLKLVLFIEAIVLLGNAVVISRDYQDSWVLEGLEIPFVLFVTTYALAFFSEKSVSWMVALAVISRSLFLLIPNLKYVWFQGTAIDQHVQYGLANHVYNEGYIATQGPSNVAIYGNTPLIHVSLAIFSIVLNIPVVNSIKYLPVFLSPIYPLLTYVILKNLKFPHGTTTLKYAVFVSSVPFSPEKYVVTGSQFGVLLTFLVLASVVMVLQKNDRRHWLIFMFFIFILAATHSVSSVLLTTFLVTILLIRKVPYFRLKSYLKFSSVFAVTLICAAWLIFPARSTLESFVRVISGVSSETTPISEQVSPRLLEIARVDMLGAINSVLVFHGADAFLLLLTLAGLIILLKVRKKVDNTLKFLSLISGLMVVLIPIGIFLLKLGGFRVLHLASLIFPVFSGIFITQASRKRAWMGVVILSLTILLAALQLYRCQPLIPSANVLSEDLPTSEPIVYAAGVNSIYQRQMIGFTEDYVDGRIACDRVTGNQIIGLTQFDFSVAHLALYYPLDKNQSERKKYDHFLIHLPGASGMFNEQAELRTTDLILKVTYNSSIIYTNGESYILTNVFPQQHD